MNLLIEVLVCTEDVTLCRRIISYRAQLRLNHELVGHISWDVNTLSLKLLSAVAVGVALYCSCTVTKHAHISETLLVNKVLASKGVVIASSGWCLVLLIVVDLGFALELLCIGHTWVIELSVVCRPLLAWLSSLLVYNSLTLCRSPVVGVLSHLYEVLRVKVHVRELDLLSMAHACWRLTSWSWSFLFSLGEGLKLHI